MMPMKEWSLGLVLAVMSGASVHAATAVRPPSPDRYTVKVSLAEVNAVGTPTELWHLQTIATAGEPAPVNLSRLTAAPVPCPAPSCLGSTVENVTAAFRVVPLSNAPDQVFVRSNLAMETLAASAHPPSDRHWSHSWSLGSSLTLGQPTLISESKDPQAGQHYRLTVTVHRAV